MSNGGTNIGQMQGQMQGDLDTTQQLMEMTRQFQVQLNLLNMAHKARMSGLEAQKNAVQQIRA